MRSRSQIDAGDYGAAAPRGEARARRSCGSSSRPGPRVRADGRPVAGIYLPIRLLVAGVAWALNGEPVAGWRVVGRMMLDRNPDNLFGRGESARRSQ